MATQWIDLGSLSDYAALSTIELTDLKGNVIATNPFIVDEKHNWLWPREEIVFEHSNSTGETSTLNRVQVGQILYAHPSYFPGFKYTDSTGTPRPQSWDKQECYYIVDDKKVILDWYNLGVGYFIVPPECYGKTIYGNYSIADYDEKTGEDFYYNPIEGKLDMDVERSASRFYNTGYPSFAFNAPTFGGETAGYKVISNGSVTVDISNAAPQYGSYGYNNMPYNNLWYDLKDSQRQFKYTSTSTADSQGNYTWTNLPTNSTKFTYTYTEKDIDNSSNNGTLQYLRLRLEPSVTDGFFGYSEKNLMGKYTGEDEFSLLKGVSVIKFVDEKYGTSLSEYGFIGRTNDLIYMPIALSEKKDHYSFNGWYDKRSADKIIPAGSVYYIPAYPETTYIVDWKEDYYHRFCFNNGSLKVDEKIYAGEGGTVPSLESLDVEKTITVDFNGGTYTSPSDKTVLNSQTVKVGQGYYYWYLDGDEINSTDLTKWARGTIITKDMSSKYITDYSEYYTGETNAKNTYWVNNGKKDFSNVYRLPTKSSLSYKDHIFKGHYLVKYSSGSYSRGGVGADARLDYETVTANGEAINSGDTLVAQWRDTYKYKFYEDSSLTSCLEYIQEIYTGEENASTSQAVPDSPKKEKTVNIHVNGGNYLPFFDISNGSYCFELDSSGNFSANNLGVNSQTATTTLTALQDMTVNISYSLISESNCDKLSLTVGGASKLSNVSGTKSGSFSSISLSKGSTIVMTYSKDASVSATGEKAMFSINIAPVLKAHYTTWQCSENSNYNLTIGGTVDRNKITEDRKYYPQASSIIDTEWYGLPSSGTYDGKKLISFNTNAYGTGTTYACGNAITYTGFTNSDLYAIWQKIVKLYFYQFNDGSSPDTNNVTLLKTIDLSDDNIANTPLLPSLQKETTREQTRYINYYTEGTNEDYDKCVVKSFTYSNMWAGGKYRISQGIKPNASIYTDDVYFYPEYTTTDNSNKEYTVREGNSYSSYYAGKSVGSKYWIGSYATTQNSLISKYAVGDKILYSSLPAGNNAFWLYPVLYTVIAKPTVDSGSLTYTGSYQTITNTYNENTMTLTGNSFTQISIGDYTAKITPKTGYCWLYGNSDAVTLSWSIIKATIYTWTFTATTVAGTSSSSNLTSESGGTVPSLPDSSSRSIYIFVNGGTSLTDNGGTYSGYKYVTRGYPSGTKWESGSTSYNPSATINKSTITSDKTFAPSASITDIITYTLPTSGERSGHTLASFNTNSSGNGGTSFEVGQTIGYSSLSSSTTYLYAIWEEARDKIKICQKTPLYYNGTPQSPSWNIYINDNIYSGNLNAYVNEDNSSVNKGTNVGTYMAKFNLNNTTYYEWTDGTTSAKSVEWTISSNAVNRNDFEVVIGKSTAGYVTATVYCNVCGISFKGAFTRTKGTTTNTGSNTFSGKTGLKSSESDYPSSVVTSGWKYSTDYTYRFKITSVTSPDISYVSVPKNITTSNPLILPA